MRDKPNLLDAAKLPCKRLVPCKFPSKFRGQAFACVCGEAA